MHLEKKVINNYVFFVIEKDFTNEIVDYYIFSPAKWMPTLEDFCFNSLNEILISEFESKKYSKRVFRKLAALYYNFDLTSGKTIDISSLPLFFQYKKKLLENDLYEDIELMKKKLTYCGVKIILERIESKYMYDPSYEKLEEQIEKRLDGYNTSNIKKELIHMAIQEDYEASLRRTNEIASAFETVKVIKANNQQLSDDIGGIVN